MSIPTNGVSETEVNLSRFWCPEATVPLDLGRVMEACTAVCLGCCIGVDAWRADHLDRCTAVRQANYGTRRPRRSVRLVISRSICATRFTR